MKFLAPLDRKLLRDLRHGWAQAVAVAAVVACGVAIIVTFMGAHRTLDETRRAHLDRSRFAHVFVVLERAPRSLVERIARLPDVASVQGRIRTAALLHVEGAQRSATGTVLSLPSRSRSALNRVHVRSGRLPEARKVDEVAVTDKFASAHRLGIGDEIEATFAGQRRSLRIVGTVVSPEFVYAIGPGDIIPDDKRFGAAFMSEAAMEDALDLRGAFNDLSLRLAHGGDEREVIARLDDILKPFGGRGAYGRDEHVSDAFVVSQIDQLASMATILPPVFLAVVAFLTAMTTSRQVTLERAQIGLLKALGYGTGAVAGHYLKQIAVVVLVGVLVGFALGDWLAGELARLHVEFFDFPFVVDQRDTSAFAIAAGAALGFGLGGALRSVWRAAGLAPAEAMSPPRPARFDRAAVPRWLVRCLPLEANMIVRHVTRFPGRAFATTAGLALSVAVLIAGMFAYSAVDDAIETAFSVVQRADATVHLVQEKPADAVREVARWPGVVRAEAVRAVPAILRYRTRSHRGFIEERGGAQMARLVDAADQIVDPPPSGLAISASMADKLGAGPGDTVTVEFTTGARGIFDVPVSRIVGQFVGMGAYMDRSVLEALLRGERYVTAVNVRVDAREWDRFVRRAEDMPHTAAVSLIKTSKSAFSRELTRNLLISVSFSVGFATVLAFGVAYNSARIGLSERARELASLRVLGFSRTQAATVLLGELGLCAVLALGPGWLIGRGLAEAVARGSSDENFTLPGHVDPATYAVAALVMVAGVALSGTGILSRVGRLDLIAVLKARD